MRLREDGKNGVKRSLRRENTLLAANKDNPWSASMSWDGSVFEKLVPSMMCLGGIIERQLERIGKPVGLFSSISAAEGRRC